MKILLISHHWKPYTHHSSSSGPQRMAWYLAEEHDVDLLAWQKKGDSFPQDEQKPFRVRRVTTPASDLMLQRRLLLSWRAMQMAGDYDLVHALYSVPGIFPSFRYPTIATTHIIPEINPRDPWLFYKGMIQRILFNRVARIITVSTNLRDILSERYGSDRVIYIPLGIDVTAFRPGMVDVEEMRQSLLRDKYQHIALMVGYHGVNHDMIKNLIRAHPQVLFIILGKPLPASDLQNTKYVSNISEEELIRFYEVANIYFRPLRFATANCALLEAMAMGKTIVIHNIPGVMDYINEEEAYLAENDEDFPVQFGRAVENVDERRRKGENARRRAEQEFAWEHITRRTIEIYKEVIG